MSGSNFPRVGSFHLPPARISWSRLPDSLKEDPRYTEVVETGGWQRQAPVHLPPVRISSRSLVLMDEPTSKVQQMVSAEGIFRREENFSSVDCLSDECIILEEGSREEDLNQEIHPQSTPEISSFESKKTLVFTDQTKKFSTSHQGLWLVEETEVLEDVLLSTPLNKHTHWLDLKKITEIFNDRMKLKGISTRTIDSVRRKLYLVHKQTFPESRLKNIPPANLEFLAEKKRLTLAYDLLVAIGEKHKYPLKD
jgi:hypothetical protein